MAMTATCLKKTTALTFIVALASAAARAQDLAAPALSAEIAVEAARLPSAQTRELIEVAGASQRPSDQDQSQSIMTLRSRAEERRPPQAAPPDPSKDPNAPPYVRHIRLTVGGFVGG